MPQMARRPATASPRVTTRPPLTREAIVAAAIELADTDGLEAVSMRRLGQRLAVDPMSLYNHVGDKDDLLDAMADAVVATIDLRPMGGAWPAALRVADHGGPHDHAPPHVGGDRPRAAT